MNPSQLVDVVFKVFTNREQRKELFTRLLNATYLVPALDSQKASSLERGEPHRGGNSMLTVRRKGTGKDCTQLRSKKENNTRKTGTSPVVERAQRSVDE